MDIYNLQEYYGNFDFFILLFFCFIFVVIIGKEFSKIKESKNVKIWATFFLKISPIKI